jgi:phosphatidylinositol-3-phosphatase
MSKMGKTMVWIFRVALATMTLGLLVMPAVGAASTIKHVFVITMENKDAKDIYGQKTRAPYINNSLIPKYARAMNFMDPLPPEIESEPHYIWMEAGTNEFADHKFTNDDDPRKSNNYTKSKDHLVTRIDNTGTVTWMTYQESMTAKTGQCPIESDPPYVAKHNPFVFFADVSGDPPSKDDENCKKHTKPYAAFASDLAANRMANYVFITPNLCHDMHGNKKCPPGDLVTAGDKWLSSELPRIIDWVNKNSGVIFIVWDEGTSANSPIPFLAIGPGVKPGYTSNVKYDHGSLVRSVQEIFNLQPLATVASKSSFADMFKPGSFP